MEKITKKKDGLTRSRFSPLTVALLVVLLLYVLIMCGMFFWAVITSLKSPNGYYNDPIGVPSAISLNYGFVFRNFKIMVSGETHTMFNMVTNSLLYAVGCAFTKTLVTCVTAYLCARYSYKFSKVIYTVVIVSMIVPIVGSLPSELQMAHTLRLHNHIWGLWIMKMNFLGMYFLVFYEFFKAMPKSYTEAAEIDGASDMRILTTIGLPLVKFTFFSVMLIYFIEYWNDYQIPLVFMPEHPTLAYGMFYLSGSGGGDLARTPYQMAMAIMVLVPILILFLCSHKRLLGNLNVGGIKG